MKKTLLGLLVLLALNVFAQSTHTIDFEPSGIGAGWDWTVAENSDNPPLEFITNPVGGGINTSATVAKFTARLAGNPWALCFTSDDGEFTFDATNSTVKIMVYKTVVSDIGFKVEGFSGNHQIVIPNTQINQWEEITFDFSAVEGNTYGTMVIIPDFDFTPRSQENIVLFDNIQVPDGVIVGPLPEPTTVPPTPPHAAADVLSIYTETYSNLPGTDFNPNWGQSTVVTVDYVAAGNNTLKYENLNYQGTQYTNQDVSGYEYLHVDYWTPNSSSLDFFLISPGAEIAYSLPITTETWGSIDIDLNDFVPPVNLADVFQFKVAGNGTVYFDNLYFWKTPPPPGSDATLSDLQVDGTTVTGFSSAILNYEVELPYGTTVAPPVTATTNDPLASHVVNAAGSLPGTTAVVVTAQDLTTTLTYNVNFTVAGLEPTTVPATPPHAEADVLSIYSDAYMDVAGTNFDPFWGQSTVVTLDYVAAGNNTLRYQNLNYQGTELVTQDVSGYEYLHVDFWTANSTELNFFLISPGPIQTSTSLPITLSDWGSVDVALADFSPVDLTNLFQLMVTGNGDVWFDNIYFWKTAGGGSITFNPLDGAINVPVDINPTLSFSSAIEMAGGSPITNGDIPSIVVLRETDAFGSNVPFTGTIDVTKKVITIIPDSDLNSNQLYYVALNNLAIQFQGGDLIPYEKINFTTMQPIQLDLYDNFDDPSSLTWGFWDNNAGGILDVEASNPSLLGQNTSPLVAKFTKESGSDAYTHAFAILGGKLDLSANNLFQMYVRSESAGSTFALKLQNNELAEPWLTEVTVEYTIQSANQWELVTYDFSPYADRTDLDKLLLMVNPGQVGAGVHYFDEVYGPPFTAPAVSPVVVDANVSEDASAIELKFDKDMEPEPGNHGNFNVYVDGIMNGVTSTYRKVDDFTVIVLNLTTPVGPGQEVLLSYLMSGTVTSLDNGILQPFVDFNVTNNLSLILDLIVFLEGPYNGFNLSADLNPDLLPLDQPYNQGPWNYLGSEDVTAIPNNNMVDWVLIEIRDAAEAYLATSGTMVARQAAFIHRNGSIVGLDGSSDLLFDVSIADSLYVVIWHRNHINVMSAVGLQKVDGKYSYNFTTAASKAYGDNQKQIATGVWSMIGGNGVADDAIDDFDKVDNWQIEAGDHGYLQGDYNMDGEVNNIDKDEIWLPNYGTSTEAYQLIWQDEFDGSGSPNGDN
jgi:hypothetical protein